VLGGSDPRGEAAAALLERAGPPGVLAMSKAYASLDATGRALAINVAASAASCVGSGKLLVGALTDPDEVVRGKAAAKLAEPSCGRQALPALVEALHADENRATVAPFVALVGREEALGPLIDALGQGSPKERMTLRAAVAYAARGARSEDLRARLASTRNQEASLELLRALQRRLGDVRDAADSAVGALLAGNPDATRRYRLVDVVGWLAASGDTAAGDHLADLAMHDPSQEVRAAAVELLALAPNAEAVAAHALADPGPRVREAVLHAIGARHQSDQVPAIVQALAHDPWTFVRVAAAESLATLPSAAPADHALADALDQASPRVRQRSLVALAARRAVSYAGAIRDRLTSPKEDVMVRSAAARALGLLCDAKATDTLAELAVAGASSADPGEVSLGLVATSALGKLHPTDLAVRFAPLAAKSARPDARAAAERALADPVHCPFPPPGH
jgi:HEAT repeat protein